MGQNTQKKKNWTYHLILGVKPISWLRYQDIGRDLKHCLACYQFELQKSVQNFTIAHACHSWWIYFSVHPIIYKNSTNKWTGSFKDHINRSDDILLHPSHWTRPGSHIREHLEFHEIYHPKHRWLDGWRSYYFSPEHAVDWRQRNWRIETGNFGSHKLFSLHYKVINKSAQNLCPGGSSVRTLFFILDVVIKIIKLHAHECTMCRHKKHADELARGTSKLLG